MVRDRASLSWILVLMLRRGCERWNLGVAFCDRLGAWGASTQSKGLLCCLTPSFPGSVFCLSEGPLDYCHWDSSVPSPPTCLSSGQDRPIQHANRTRMHPLAQEGSPGAESGDLRDLQKRRLPAQGYAYSLCEAHPEFQISACSSIKPSLHVAQAPLL